MMGRGELRSEDSMAAQQSKLRRTHITVHKRAADAGPDALRRVLGSIVLKGPRPSGKFLDEAYNERAGEHGRD
jgi:hypothetical protein